MSSASREQKTLKGPKSERDCCLVDFISSSEKEDKTSLTFTPLSKPDMTIIFLLYGCDGNFNIASVFNLSRKIF